MRTTTCARGANIATATPGAHGAPDEKTKTMRSLKGNMDAMKLTGIVVAVVLTVPIVANAEPGTLALIEIGLVGVLYMLRRRRLSLDGWR
jgi:hypothetical protein